MAIFQVQEYTAGQHKVNNWVISAFLHQLHVVDNRVGIYDNGRRQYIVPLTIFSDWLDPAGAPYGSVALLITDLNTFFFDVSLPYPEVDTRNDLPITLGTPSIGEKYLVNNPVSDTIMGIPYRTYQSGLYRRDTNAGALSDWRRLNVKIQYTDAELQVHGVGDTGKVFKFLASGLTSGTIRELTIQDADGTIAYLSDITGALHVIGPGSATDNAIARFDTTTGKLIQNSSVLIDDSGNVTLVGKAKIVGYIIQSFTLSIPNIVNDRVKVGEFFFGVNRGTAHIEISILTGSTFVAKQYSFVATRGEQSALTEVLPVIESDTNTGNNFELEIQDDNNDLQIYVRRTAGTANMAAKHITVRVTGSEGSGGIFTADGSTIDAVAAPSIFHKSSVVSMDTDAETLTIGLASTIINLKGTINVVDFMRIERTSNEIALILRDSGGDDTILHTVNDGQGNYNIMIGVDGDGNHIITGDGASKLLLNGHNVDGYTSLNAAPMGDSGDPVVFNIGISLDSTDQLLRIGNPANISGLSVGQGNAIADVDGNLITDFIDARSAAGLTLATTSGDVVLSPVGNVLLSPAGGEVQVDVVNALLDILGNTKVRGGTNSNKYDLVELSSTDVGSGPFAGGKVRGNFYYVADSTADNLHIYDLTDLTAPQLVGTLNIASTNFGGIDVVGQYVYLTDTTGDTLYIVDALDKTNPVLVGTPPTLAGVTNPRGVRGTAGVVFMCSDTQFTSVDITDLSNPVQIQTISIPGNGTINFELEGIYAYVNTLDATNNVNIIDVSDPSNMSIVGQFDIGTNCRAVRKERSLLYCTGASGNLVILDVSDPTTPTQSASYAVAGDPRVLDVQNGIVYVGRQAGDDIAVVDASNLASIVEITNLFAVDQNPVSIDVQGNIMYVLDGNLDTLKIIDVSGSDFQNIKTGSIETSRAIVINDLTVGRSVTADGVQVGGGGVASGGQVTSTVDGVSQAVSQKSANVVEVFTAAQLPTTLVANTTYIIKAPIIITGGNEITIPNAGGIRILSTHREVNTITYTGTGTLFTSALMTGGFHCELTEFIGTGVGATLFALTGDNTAFSAAISFLQCDWKEWNNLGTITAYQAGIVMDHFGVSNVGSGLICSDGFFVGVHDTFWSNSVDMNDSFIHIDSNISRVSITNSGFNMGANPNERMVDIDAAFTGEVIINTVFAIPTGQMFDGAGLDEKSIYVNSRNVTNNIDSKSIGTAFIKNNVTETTIATQNVWVDFNLNAGVIGGSNLERFTLTDTTTGELTYIGLEPFSGTVIYSVTGVSAGGAQEFAFREVKNGLELPDAVEASIELGTDKLSTTVIVSLELVTGDTIRPQTKNNDGTSNVTISHWSVETK